MRKCALLGSYREVRNRQRLFVPVRPGVPKCAFSGIEAFGPPLAMLSAKCGGVGTDGRGR